MVLEIPPLGHAAKEEVSARLPILAQLRAQGFRLAFNHSVLESAYTPWLQLADFIKLDLSVLRPDQLAVLIYYASRILLSRTDLNRDWIIPVSLACGYGIYYACMYLF